MKNLYSSVKGLCVLLALFFSLLLHAQIPTLPQQHEQDIVKFLQAGSSDASKLIGGYIGPAIEGLSYGLNTGWYTTAKAHKPLGVDIGFSISPVFIPKSKDYFDPTALSLQTVKAFSNDDHPLLGAPSFFGPKDKTTYYTDLDGDGNLESFAGPEGLNVRKDLKVAPVVMPVAQIGIGLIKGTDLKVRYMPTVELGGTKVSLIGFGLLHDVKQHIPGIKILPFDLSILAAYSKFKGTTDLSGYFDPGPGDTRAQEGVYDFSAFLLEGLISKKIAIVTLYGGLGYNGIKTTAKINGSYTINGFPAALVDPYSQVIKNKSARFDAGVRLNLLAFYLMGQFTAQEYSSVTFGMGLTFR